MQRIRNDQVVTDGLHIEWHKVTWKTIIGERFVIAPVPVIVVVVTMPIVIFVLQLYALNVLS